MVICKFVYSRVLELKNKARVFFSSNNSIISSTGNSPNDPIKAQFTMPYMEVTNLFPRLVVLQYLNLSLRSTTRLLLKLNAELVLLFRCYHYSYIRQAQFTRSKRLKADKQKIMRYFGLLGAPESYSRFFFFVEL